MRLSKFMVTVLMMLAFVMSSYPQDKRDLLRRKARLKKLKASCMRKSEPKRSDCLTEYQEKAAQYKEDVASFKARANQENRERRARLASRGSRTIDEDIAKRTESIRQFEEFYASSCSQNKTARCASALYQLGNLNYRNEEDSFRMLQGKFEKDIQRWEDRDKRGPEPQPPQRSHTKSLSYFEKLLREYPKYGDMVKVFYRMAFIYSIQGKDNESYAMLEKLVNKYPDHGLTIPAYLRMGEHWFLLRKYNKAIEFYDKVPSGYQGTEADLALYHKAECYYNMADFSTAAKYYYEYIIKSDKGLIKGDLRAEAMEFLATCWADLEDGVDVAYRFLKSKGHPWEKDVYFQMGMKNKAHDRLEEARKAFHHLLKIDPLYPKAPIADMTIVSTLIIEKRADEAQDARIALVERYRPGSQWEQRNSGDKKNMQEAQKALKQAMFQIPLYYHLKSTKNKDNPDKQMMSNAEEHYRKYLSRYNENSWDVYEVHQNLASLYHIKSDYSAAASEYEWCMNAPIEKYGKMPQEKKKTILTKSDAAYNRVYMLDLERQAYLKTVGGKEDQAYSGTATANYFAAVDDYMSQFGSSNSAPDIAYNAALVHYKAKKYAKAIVSLRDLRQKFPTHKHSNLIRRMLGQSLLEDGQYAESEQIFTELLAKTNKSAKEYTDIQLSVASAIFKQADEKVKASDHQGAAELYLRMVKKFPNVKISDKALFEAGIQYEKANMVEQSASTLLRIHREYPNSDLKIKSVMRAASVYKNGKQMKNAGQTFLVIANRFPKDSTAFNSIGWAAEAYSAIPDLVLAARTYESVYDKFPRNKKTPAFLYNAGQTYEELKDFRNAVRIYNLLGDKYPKSQYALEAIFSVPIIQEKQGNYTGAVASYKRFISSYANEPQKLIRAQFRAGKIYDDHMNKDNEALAMFKAVKKTYEKNKKKTEFPPAIPAEAAFRSGEIYFNLVQKTRLNSTPKNNKRALKAMTKDLQVAIEHFSGAVEHSEQEFTLQSTMRMGDLFIAMARITSNEKIHTKNKIKIAGEKISRLKGLPALYGKARGLYQKNLDLAKEQAIKSKWIDSSQVKYMNTYLLEGKVYEDIGEVLGSSPIPKELTGEDRENYKAAIDDKKYEMRQAAKPIYGTALKAAQFYYIKNEVRDEIIARLRDIDPESQELNIRVEDPVESAVPFVDDAYKSNMERITLIYEDPNMSSRKKISELSKIELAAKQEITRLNNELKVLSQSGATSSN